MAGPQHTPRGHSTPAPTPTVELSLIGGFSLRCDGRTYALPQQAQRVIALLALRHRSLLRSHVAALLWLDKDEERAGANLRSSLWRLGRVPSPVVVATREHIQLAPGVAVDARDAVGLAERLCDPDAPVVVGAVDAGLLEADLLPEWYDDWVVLERERFHQLRLHALERLTRHFTAVGRVAQAIAIGTSTVLADPLRESAARALVEAHLAIGNVNEALREYTRYREMLGDQLGLVPSQTFERMVAPLRRTDPEPASVMRL
jgi:DNA-binding SARP family transcriptional activator